MIRLLSTLEVLLPAIVCGVPVAPHVWSVNRTLVPPVDTTSELATGMSHDLTVFSSQFYAAKG